MLKGIDRTFGVLLILACAGHTAGTILWLPVMTGMWVWSLGAALGGYVLGSLNIVRAGRPDDRVIAFIAVAGTACWALVALSFNYSIHNMLDPRGLGHFILSMVLVGFGLRTLILSYGARDRSFTSGAAAA